jgi:hypothetical protein
MVSGWNFSLKSHSIESSHSPLQVVTILSKQTNIAVAVLVGVSICAISFAWDAGNDFKLSESMKLGIFSEGMGPARERATPDLGRCQITSSPFCV